MRFAGKTVLFTAAAIFTAAFVSFDYATVWNTQLGAFYAGAASFGANLSSPFALPFIILFGILAFLAGRCRVRWLVGRCVDLALFAIVIGVQIWAARAAAPFLKTMPWGIDHPCFIFRIREFLDVFPALGTYNTWWNGGVEHFIGVTSGAHAFAFLLLPFLPFGSLEEIYGPALFFWIFVGGPWLAAAAMRLLGCRARTCLVAALLMLPFSRAEFLFFWQSGNVGGLVTCLMAPLVVALSFKLAVLRRGGMLDAAILGVAAWLSCIWPAGFVTAAGLFAGALLSWRRWMRPKPFRPLFAAAAIAIVLLSPWIWALLFPSRAIVSYVSDAPEAISRSAALSAGLCQLFRRIAEWHPLILPFGVAGTLVLRIPRSRRFFGALFATLAAVVVSVGFLRNSQLDRVALQMAAAAVVPASIAVARLRAIAMPTGKGRTAAVAKAFAVVLAKGAVVWVLAFSPVVAVSHAANSSGFKLWPTEPVVKYFADWIRDNVPPHGRLAFADLTDCKYDWGKIAYLPVMTGREMMSDDYYGFPKGLTSRRFPPRAYRSSEKAYVAFTRLYGITHWSVTDDRNRRFFDNSPHFAHCARFAMQNSRIDIYRFLDQPDPTPFLVGEGDVSAKPGSIKVKPADPNGGLLVLRYNWRPGLHCTEGAAIEPFNADENLKFIAVRTNGLREVEITYRPGWRRLEPNFDGTFHH